ncbi:MAG: hypothetical protein JWQ71_4751 [Pedosphaera sp.]|nr:hypothetical protein [Pedosphaera sp.]
MDFELLFRSIKEACQESPILLLLAFLMVCALTFIIVDAHKHKKIRPGGRRLK